MKLYLRRATAGFMGFFVLGLATVNLDSAPPVWWDEGWTLSVARNWVVDGHYGRYLLGQPAPPDLAAAFPVTASVAMSFRFFGVGLIQGRVPSVLFTLGTLALLYHLARHLYDRRVGITALLVLLFTPFHYDIHPVLAGRQVLGEMPALFFLLAGYTVFLSAQKRPLIALPLSACFWGVALVTKLQVFPFWLASILVPLAIALLTRRWKIVLLLTVGLCASFLSARGIIWLQQILLDGATNRLSPMPGLYYVTALVTAPRARALALSFTAFFGIPTVGGLCYVAWKLMKGKRQVFAPNQAEIVQLSLLVLAATWFVWFLILSAGWLRYFFPVTVIGSIFTAAMLVNLTSNLTQRPQRNAVASSTCGPWLTIPRIATTLILLVVAASVPLTLRMLRYTYFTNADSSILQVSHFLNTETSSNALIETYDPELFFLLERPYHYPPDQLHIKLIRRYIFRQPLAIEYDPLAQDPEYLVVGPRRKLWPLYEAVLSTGAFHLIKSYGDYQIYHRLR